MKQINLKLPDTLFKSAQNYVKEFGFRNIQELAAESMREKIFEELDYDESFSEKEIELIDKLIEASIKKDKFGTEEDLKKALR